MTIHIDLQIFLHPLQVQELRPRGSTATAGDRGETWRAPKRRIRGGKLFSPWDIELAVVTYRN